METIDGGGDAPQQTQPLESVTASFDEGFENFFNNETLSDRVLYICETEKVGIIIFLVCVLFHQQ